MVETPGRKIVVIVEDTQEIAQLMKDTLNAEPEFQAVIAADRRNGRLCSDRRRARAGRISRHPSDKRHYNPLGGVHGGYFCTLLDSALGCAVHSTLPKGIGYTTLELKVNLIRSLNDKVGPVRAEGKTVHVGSRVGIAEATITDVDGKLYAHATTTCLIFPFP